MPAAAWVVLALLVANPAAGRRLADVPPTAFDAGAHLVGLARDGRAPAAALAEAALRPGDVVALEVAPAFFFSERLDAHFSLTKRFRDVELPRTERATVALVITGAMVALAAFGVMSMLNAALLASAAIMFPIALAVAGDLGVSFMPFVVALMLGTSYAFINPAGYQTNLMVLRPGGYTFADFAKVGLPVTVLVGAVTVVLAPLVFGF
jgi:hypothetical protein